MPPRFRYLKAITDRIHDPLETSEGHVGYRASWFKFRHRRGPAIK